MRPSPEQIDRIYQAWQKGHAPTVVAKRLRLAMSTIIAEYVRLDEEHGHRFH